MTEGTPVEHYGVLYQRLNVYSYAHNFCYYFKCVNCQTGHLFILLRLSAVSATLSVNYRLAPVNQLRPVHMKHIKATTLIWSYKIKLSWISHSFHDVCWRPLHPWWYKNLKLSFENVIHMDQTLQLVRPFSHLTLQITKTISCKHPFVLPFQSNLVETI